jgi:hypothetical protein
MPGPAAAVDTTGTGTTPVRIRSSAERPSSVVEAVGEKAAAELVAKRAKAATTLQHAWFRLLYGTNKVAAIKIAVKHLHTRIEREKNGLEDHKAKFLEDFSKGKDEDNYFLKKHKEVDGKEGESVSRMTAEVKHKARVRDANDVFQVKEPVALLHLAPHIRNTLYVSEHAVICHRAPFR